MSHSRKQPYGSITVCGSRAGVTKWDKRRHHHALRTKEQNALRSTLCGEEPLFPVREDGFDPWSWACDGKTYHGEDPRWRRK
ncbi:MAG: hypothetical protein SPD11_00065 [Sphaerochaetaceae bacterium]|nr:hypothetical protein [Sphaerochaetaceae bacterium]